jgi:peptidoglycan/LPS O-acetylase OafA/YrhL
LWTLTYEVRCYLFLLLIWAVLRDKTVVVLFASGAAIVLSFVPAVYEATLHLSYTLIPFVGGMTMYWFYERFGTSILMGIACAGAMVVAVFAHVQNYAFAIAGAYLLVLLAQYSNPLSRFAARWGDLSYGVYLFGWPIQMLLKPLTITGSGWELFAYSLPASMAVAGVSWWCVERPSLRAKGLLKNSAILLQHATWALKPSSLSASARGT